MNFDLKISRKFCSTLFTLFFLVLTTEAFQPYRIADIKPKCERVSASLCMPTTSESKTTQSPSGRYRRTAAEQFNFQTNHNNFEKSRKKRRTSAEAIEWRYNTTTYPNFANDVTSDDVIESLRKLHPMIATECSKFVKLFLCSVFSPVCTEFGVVPPCRELCYKVESDCARTIKEFGIQWPEEIQCDFFPAYQSDDDVVNEQTFIGGVMSQDDDYAIVIQRSARLTWMEALAADGKICIPPSEDDVITPQLELLAKNLHMRPEEKNITSYSQANHQFGVWCPAEMRSPPGQSGYTFLGMKNCSPPCPNMYLSDGELSSVRYVIIFMSSLCIMVTFFALCTFLIDTKRFRYPERPIVFYALAYFIVSVVFLAGFILKEDAACNDGIRDEETNDIVQGFTVVKGDHKQSCTILFMILYYFTVNGTIWWLILTITWLLAAGFKWGSEAIEKYSIYYHAVAWGIPAVQTMLVVTFSKIEGDNISGVCFLGLYDSGGLRYLLLTPLCFYLFLGITILCAGFGCLNRVRRKLRNDEVNKRKLSKFMTRIGVFSVMYIVPQVILFSIYIFEDSHRTRWEATWFLKACDEYRVPCPALDSNIAVTAGGGDDQPHVMLFVAKYFMTLIVALPPLFWVASKKTLLSWKLFFIREKTTSHSHIVTRNNNNHNHFRNQNSSKKALLRDGSTSANNYQEQVRRPRSLGDGVLENDDVFVGLENATKLHGSSASVAARAKAVAEGQNSRNNSILQHHVVEESHSQSMPPPPPPPLPTLANDLSVRKKTQYKKEFPERRKHRGTASTSSRGVTSSLSSLPAVARRTQSQTSVNLKHTSSLDKNEFKEQLAQKFSASSHVAAPSRPDTASSVPSDSKPKPPPKSSIVIALAKAKLEGENSMKH